MTMSWTCSKKKRQTDKFYEKRIIQSNGGPIDHGPSRQKPWWLLLCPGFPCWSKCYTIRDRQSAAIWMQLRKNRSVQPWWICDDGPLQGEGHPLWRTGDAGATKDAPRRTAIYIQYDGHPETLGYDFKSITEAIAVLRLFAAGKIRGAQNRLRKTRE